MSARKKKTVKAWALVSSDGHMLRQFAGPLVWLKRSDIADYRRAYGIRSYKISRVTITVDQ